MATHGLELWADGDTSAGIWQCAPGPSRWTLETNEVIYLVAGRMTVTPDGGAPDGDRRRRHGGVPQGLDGHLGHPRHRAKGLLDLLSRADPVQLRPVTDRRRREIASTLAASSSTPPVTKKLM